MAVTIHIIDVGLGNLFSVAAALSRSGADVQFVERDSHLSGARAIVLPGVGSFADAMDRLDQRGLVDGLRMFAQDGGRIMGICLGMQLLFESSTERGITEGLGILPGTVVRLPEKGQEAPVPHIQWARVLPWAEDSKLEPLGITADSYYYHVHSYHCQTDLSEICVGKTTYVDRTFVSVVQQEEIRATQFHPEKSGPEGLAIYRSFINSISG
jgi:imidazole glycerol-phosphate synthase subunit HisH